MNESTNMGTKGSSGITLLHFLTHTTISPLSLFQYQGTPRLCVVIEHRIWDLYFIAVVSDRSSTPAQATAVLFVQALLQHHLGQWCLLQSQRQWLHLLSSLMCNICNELKSSRFSTEMSYGLPLQTVCAYKVFPSLFSLILTLMFPFSLASSNIVQHRLRYLCPKYCVVTGSERGSGFPLILSHFIWCLWSLVYLRLPG